jgi:DNA-binding Lrp family transcriptional regulator
MAGNVSMMHAFVLLNSEPGAEEIVLKQVQTVEGIEEAHVTYGTYDLVVKVKAETPEKLKAVTHKIRSIQQVSSTLTLMMIED